MKAKPQIYAFQQYKLILVILKAFSETHAVKMSISWKKASKDERRILPSSNSGINTMLEFTHQRIHLLFPKLRLRRFSKIRFYTIMKPRL